MFPENLGYILTLDEAMLPLDFKNCKKAGFSYRGQTRLYSIPRKAKVNADVFNRLVVKPMFDFDVPNLYGADAHKVIPRMDIALSHTAKGRPMAPKPRKKVHNEDSGWRIVQTCLQWTSSQTATSRENFPTESTPPKPA
ncbi:hypothetical protein RvY_02087 [Ramazzottius varieornatus]|uniref:Uncharacterized protein n=1 Tax=Ramazzottius varieornatus TaxID=947166 RepID=A0A1D1UTP4_RAMVA|nr:hypothetical protein RvY_02087 [Ramazzottius varieornatus]